MIYNSYINSHPFPHSLQAPVLHWWWIDRAKRAGIQRCTSGGLSYEVWVISIPQMRSNPPRSFVGCFWTNMSRFLRYFCYAKPKVTPKNGSNGIFTNLNLHLFLILFNGDLLLMFNDFLFFWRWPCRSLPPIRQSPVSVTIMLDRPS